MARLHELNLVWNVTPNWYIGDLLLAWHCFYFVYVNHLFSDFYWLETYRRRIWCKKIFSLLTSLTSSEDENISQKMFFWTILMSILFWQILKKSGFSKENISIYRKKMIFKKICWFFVTKIRCEKMSNCKTKVDSLLWLRENGCFLGCIGHFGLVINSKSN